MKNYKELQKSGSHLHDLGGTVQWVGLGILAFGLLSFIVLLAGLNGHMSSGGEILWTMFFLLSCSLGSAAWISGKLFSVLGETITAFADMAENSHKLVEQTRPLDDEKE